MVNDGSKDETLQELIDAFELAPADRLPTSAVPTAKVRGVYRSDRHPNLWVIDKENGGKADALNTGLNYSRTPLFCALDADTLLEPEALMRIVRPFLEDVRTVAVGGIIRIANGCIVDRGIVEDIRLPRLQVIEYLRAFLASRVGWNAVGGTLIISGAFGAFRRSVVADAGGYSTDTVGADMELVVRLHRHCRDNAIPYRIAFIPDPVAWTEAPETVRILGTQRERWQRGLAQVLTRNLGMMRPRYGVPGMIAFPYYFIFEMVGPVVELVGYATFVLALVTGAASYAFAAAFLILAALFGTVLSVAALALEELSFRRYRRRSDLVRLLLFTVVDGFGYRQLSLWWRIKGLIGPIRRKQGWGTMQRTGFTSPEPSALPKTPAAPADRIA